MTFFFSKKNKLFILKKKKNSHFIYMNNIYIYIYIYNQLLITSVSSLLTTQNVSFCVNENSKIKNCFFFSKT